MASPTLAVSRRCQQTVDQLLVCIRRSIFYEPLHFGRRGRQSGEIEGSAANQRPLVGLWRRRELLRFEAADDESIDLIAGPCAAVYLWERHHPRLLQGPQRTLPGGGGPVGGQRRAVAYPPLELGHDLRRQRLARGHFEVLIGV